MNMSGYKNCSHNKYTLLIKILYIMPYRWMYRFNLLSAAVMIRTMLTQSGAGQDISEVWVRYRKPDYYRYQCQA